MTENFRVRQLFDCADVALNLVRAGRNAGMPWELIDGPWTRGSTKYAYYRFIAEMAWAYPRTDLWHVNMGGRAKWARGRFARPYALTLHGTDIRESYWTDSHHAAIKADIERAGQVWYTTPDLQEKAQSVRADAEYLPAPLDFDSLPVWAPAARRRIIFPSRWDASKGGEAQIQVAREVVQGVRGRNVDVVGLDWGDMSAAAAEAGVMLVPRMEQSKYLLELSQAHVAIGQSAGSFGVSELQAMAIGVPTIMPALHHGYGSNVGALVVKPSQVAEAAVASLEDAAETSRTLEGKKYVRREHDGRLLIPKLMQGYAKVMDQQA